jgi:hypothetical protein
MDITQIGSLNTYLKQENLKTQWNLKKETGNYSAHAKSLDEWLSDQTEASEAYSAYTASASDESSNGDTKLQSIRQKIYNGGSLTTEEKEYLQKKDAVTYAKVRAMEQEQKSYEASLRRCKTKDDVERLKMTKMTGALSELKAAKGDLGAVMMVNAKVKGIVRITQKFVQEGNYQDLPTDAEKVQAEKELREDAAAQAESGEQTEAQAAEQTVEQTPGQPAEQVAANTEEKGEAAPEKAEAASKADGSAKAGKADAAQESPEVRKVRRAKAGAYIHWVDWEQESAALEVDGGSQVDAKA